jgi:hypothetical protein
LVQDEVALLVGGRAMEAYRKTLVSIGAILVEDLAHFGLILEKLRRPSKTRT